MTKDDLMGDWAEVFAYAGDCEEYQDGVYAFNGQPFMRKPCSCDPTISACVGSTASTAPVLRRDVVRVIAASEGKNDGPNWLIVVELADGRFAFVEAGCDYTGWDCQAGGSCTTATSLGELYQFGLTEEARGRLAAQLAEAGADRQA
jgi:hypothetical protein